MAAKVHENNTGFVVSQNSHLSYVLSITLPQPTIRIKIPKVLIKAMQRRNNQIRSENDGNGGKNMKKYWVASKKGFRKKVGSVFSNVFGGGGNKNKKSAAETGFKGENGEFYDNIGDEEDDMKKLKNMIESIDMGSEKIITSKSSEDNHINLSDGLQQIVTVPTGFSISKSNLVLKEMVEGEDEAKKEPMVKKMVEAGNERKERSKSVRTFFSKNTSRINDLELKKAKINQNVVDDDNNIIVRDTNLSVAFVGDSKGENKLGTKGILPMKQAENTPSLTRIRSRTMSSSYNRKPKIAWSMRKMGGGGGRGGGGGKSENRELCKKRILMGGKCKPLNHSGIIQYDENGVLMPEIIP